MVRGGTATDFIRNLTVCSIVFVMRLHNLISIKEKRRDLRNNMTASEKLLWSELKNDKLRYRFRRQFSIGYYIVDFYCPKKKLAIELDGEVHVSQKEYDQIRDKFMKEFGILVVRFQNNDIRNNLNMVLKQIKELLTLD